jgi:16S rRNA (uracil1498-N3)-methyltransferase
MHRFFAVKDDICADNIKIHGEDVAHISKVLRLRIGDNIIIGDGEKYEYLCSVKEIDKKFITCSIIEKSENESEPPIKVDLYQGIPKSAKMDVIIQKCTEIGVEKIIPVNTERVIVKTTEGKEFLSKIERWQKISEEAAKQSGRGRIPDIEKPITFNEAVMRFKDYDMVLMPYEKEKATGLKQLIKSKNNIRKIAVFIGPEGGFSNEETFVAENNGAALVTLGPRILRTETAGFVTLAVTMYELGDMGGE